MIPQIDYFVGSEFVFDKLFPNSRGRPWMSWRMSVPS